MNIFEQINEIANVCESIINEATLTTPEIRTRIEKQQEIAKKSQEENRPKKAKIEAAKEAIKNVLNSMRNKDKEAIHCSYIDEGRHAKDIDPKLWTKMKNMKYIDPEYYNLSPEQYAKVMKNLENQEKFKNKIADAQASGDQAAENIIGGQIKRTQNIARRQTKEARAKIWKSIGKRLQSQIVRDPSKMRKKK